MRRENISYRKLKQIEEEKLKLAHEIEQVVLKLDNILYSIREFKELLKEYNWTVSIKEVGILQGLVKFTEGFLNETIHKVEVLVEKEKEVLNEIKYDIEKELYEIKVITKTEKEELHDISELEKIIRREEQYIQISSSHYPLKSFDIPLKIMTSFGAKI